MITTNQTNIPIVVADDDKDDCMIASKAFKKANITNPVYFVHDGEALIQYLKNEAEYSDPVCAPKPGLILLDLNMPKIDGKTAIKTIKADPELHNIPVVFFTTSSSVEDIRTCYALGANAYITKPANFSDMVNTMKSLVSHWFNFVSLPTLRP